ncbi:MAG: FAD-dependent oxidoreductase [Deltaproteobacteria bacterium]|nr:FAD-dependent oxidoreductase [Deltaproteobacteria bacterium]
MKREITELENRTFDAVIIGAGIYGTLVAWRLATAGYQVAIVEKGDFCAATSANSLKILHGGLRYLQHLDFKRMRESIKSRREIMRFAPHLVAPLPCLVPTAGLGMRSRLMMKSAFLANDLISRDRNRGLAREKQLPPGRIMGRTEIKKILPDLSRREITGGAVWYDGLAVNTERIALEYLLTACDCGAAAANYIRVDRIVTKDGKVTGITATDLLAGTPLAIRADRVINCAGPWFAELLRASGLPAPQVRWAKAVNLVVRKQITATCAVGLESRAGDDRDPDAVIKRGGRLYFFVPWKGLMMIGTTYQRFEQAPDRVRATREDLVTILEEANSLYPSLRLEYGDICFFHCGLVPMADKQEVDADTVPLAKHPLVIDHADTGGPAGLVSLCGIKYTTAPIVADEVLRLLGGEKSPLPARKTDKINRPSSPGWPGSLAAERLAALHDRYAHRSVRVAEYIVASRDSERWLCRQPDLQAGEVIYFIREEMAETLADVVLRRSGLGDTGSPGRDVLQRIAEVMAAELSWDTTRKEREVAAVEGRYYPLVLPG